MRLTDPDPSVDGPPTKAIILAPEPGTQSPNKLAAILSAVLVHLDARWSAGTGQGSLGSSSSTYIQIDPKMYVNIIVYLLKY